MAPVSGMGWVSTGQVHEGPVGKGTQWSRTLWATWAFLAERAAKGDGVWNVFASPT